MDAIHLGNEGGAISRLLSQVRLTIPRVDGPCTQPGQGETMSDHVVVGPAVRVVGVLTVI